SSPVHVHALPSAGMRSRLTLAAAATAVGAALLPLTGAAAPVFTPNVTNPWFPLRPGTVFVFRGVKDGKPTRDVVAVSRATRVIAGVRCAVVSDRLYREGRVSERTLDWYAQDAKGNVWYFGESTAELDREGHVTSTEGTWQAGRNGAQPGIYM